MKAISGGITAPRGFLAAGIHAGIKASPDLDLALVVSERAGPVAGVFTTNRVAAAPVVVDREHLRRKIGRAIIINSGNANACTGNRGLANARDMARLVARLIGARPHSVFVGSTGVIGVPLPMPHIRRGILTLVRRLASKGAREAARAILTTDTKRKEIALSARIGGRTITVGGMAKGSGMIHPDLATMLAYLTTDAAIEQVALQRALRMSVQASFNGISVDGDTSTNDTVLCLANGLAKNTRLRAGTRQLAEFQRVLDRACQSLAMQICQDGEGVTKVVELDVRGARTCAEASQVARTVATSNLVKTALFGEDANWGRIVAAIGRSGVRVDPSSIGLAFGGVAIMRNGVGLGHSVEKRIRRIMKRREFTITINLGQGLASRRMWTTDLTDEYVRINASYRS
ncbi:MAG: bifunctional glutamate N-acetyltransferase/amino-acid acetyltransferase ArgJ [Nitrospiraceae bacterium]